MVESVTPEEEVLIVTSTEVAPTVVAEKSATTMTGPKTKTHKSRKPCRTDSQESVDMAEQASLTAKRTFELESTPSTSAASVDGDKAVSLQNGRFHPDARIVQ